MQEILIDRGEFVLEGLIQELDDFCVAFHKDFSVRLPIDHENSPDSPKIKKKYNNRELTAGDFNAELVEVPEPATIGLLAIGAAGLLVVRRTKK
jgi:hypothetical protein